LGIQKDKRRFLWFPLLVLLLLFTSVSSLSYAQVVRGRIIDNLGQEVPYGTIRVRGAAYGTSSNANGIYQLELKKGKYVLIFSSFGYTSFIDTVEMDQSVLTLNVTLQEDIKEMEEVVIVYVSDKEKGKKIMKKVIDKRSYYQDLLKEYTCQTYCFSSLEKNHMDSLIKDSVLGKEKLNMMEWRAKSYYKANTNFKDEFFGYKDFIDKNKKMVETGSTIGVSYNSSNSTLAPTSAPENNPYIFVDGIKEAHFSLFDNTIDEPRIVQNPLISPLAYNAFVYYNFYFVQSFYDSLNQMVYEINVKPRFEYEALFEGTLFIRDESWAIVSYDLKINPGVLLYFKDIRIICDYKQDGERIVPVRKEFIYNIKEGKENINGSIRLSHSDYSYTIDKKSSKFWLQMAVYTEDAFDKDTSYWNENRPFTLKEYELKFIKEQDSIISYHESDEFLRTSDSIRNEIKVIPMILNGYFHVNSFKKEEYGIDGLLQQVVPFGVGGYRHRLGGYYQKEFKSGKRIKVSPQLDYGFSNKDLKGSFDGEMMYNPLNFSTLGFQVGDVYDFVSGAQNIQSSLAPSNRVRNQKAELRFSRELINGLYLESRLLYSDRRSIDDLIYPGWVSTFGKFQIPQSFDRYKIVMTTFEFEYVIRQKYMIRRNRKYVYPSIWPRINLTYKKAIPRVLSAEANFDFLELKITDDIKFNSLGISQLQFLIGSFLQKKDLRLIEHKYFRPSDKRYFSNPLNSLQLLDTAINTANSYLQLNFIHHFNGFFLNKVWLLNRLKLEETAGGGVLSIPDAHFFQAEFYAGLERKFRIRKTIFKIGAYAVSQANTSTGGSVSFKFGFNLYDAFHNKWDY
jgi:hypothetical protein